MPAPRDPAFDSTLALLREGYPFLWNRCRRAGSDVVRMRLLGRATIGIHGPEAAAVFYDETRFERHGAVPRRVITSLFGKGAIHTLDGEAHRVRRSAFLSLMGPESLAALVGRAADEWRAAVRRWEDAGTVVLFDEAAIVLARAVCGWTGLPVDDDDAADLARDFVAMIDAFGGVGPRLWRGKLARGRVEQRVETAIERMRLGAVPAPPESAIAVMAGHHGADGLLPARTAAVELVNVLRPTVAIAWYVTFAALALHRQPEAIERIAAEPWTMSAGTYADAFAQEVRRLYPFAPFLGARVKTPFEWRDQRFEPGTRVLLDVYGTLHDPAIWPAPDRFWADRFLDRPVGAYDLIPQGGGPRATGHRCPGEWITLHQLALALHVLARGVRYEVVPGQDLGFPLTRMPTRPVSGFRIRRVRALPALDAPVPPLPSRRAAEDGARAVERGELAG